VELSRTLVQFGRAPGQGNGRPARVERSEAARRHLRQRQLDLERRHIEAAAGLAGAPLDVDTELDEAQVGVLRRLLDIALAARVAGRADVPLAAAAFGVRLTLTPIPGRFATVATVKGRLHLDGYALTVVPAAHTRAGAAA
jgi:hypothetical protein